MANIIKRVKNIASGIKDIGVGSAMISGAVGGTIGLRIIGSESSDLSKLGEMGMSKFEKGVAHVKMLGGDVSTYRKLNKK